MKNAFLIVNYNDAETTQSLLQNIANYQCLDLIVVVDNGSTDSSYKKLCKHENQKIVVLKNKENKGYAAGINYGVKYLVDLYSIQNIIVSNADMVIRNENDLKKLFKVLDKKKNVAVAAPVIMETEGKNRGWKVPTPRQDALLNLPWIHRKLRKKWLFYGEEHYQDKLSYVEAVSGCFFVCKASVLKKIYYFDENTFLYYEENILASKLKNIGMDTVIVNDVSVVHNHAVTIDKNVSKLNKIKILKKSQYYFQVHYNQANWLEKILLKLTKGFSYLFLSIYYKIKK